MSYKITIRENTKVKRNKQGEYMKIGVDEDGEDKWEYAPRYDDIVDTDIEIFSQVVEDMDIIKVIMAVNSEVE